MPSPATVQLLPAAVTFGLTFGQMMAPAAKPTMIQPQWTRIPAS